MISYLCNISGVSRSGYYRYFSSAIIEKRKSNEIKDSLMSIFCTQKVSL